MEAEERAISLNRRSLLYRVTDTGGMSSAKTGSLFGRKEEEVRFREQAYPVNIRPGPN
jgi:hypothetical protein